MNGAAKSSAFLVQFNGKSLLWQADRPMALGHPFRFVLERTSSGVRVRDLKRPHCVELKSNEIDQSASIALPNSNARLSIKRISSKKSVIESISGEMISATSEWSVYERRGSVVVESSKLRFPFVAHSYGQELFRIEKTSGEWALVPLVDGITLFSPHTREKQTFQKGNRYELLATKTSSFFISHGPISFVFSRSETTAIAARDVLEPHDQLENDRFKKGLKASVSSIFSLLLLSILWPKAEVKEEPLIPPQFTKIVMMKQSKSSAPQAETPVAQTEASAAPKGDKAPPQAKNAKVVQAFRAKALQNAVKGLLRGGMTTLIAQNNLLAGSSVGQARAMLNSKAEAGITSAPVVGLNGSKSVQVASLGGGGVAGSKGVGYGKGESGKVSGQGQGFVSLDLGNSTVEEGLTKEEVGRVIHAHMSEIRYCYESTMIASPDLEGKLLLDFTIGSQGLIKVASVRESSLRDPRLDDCVVRRLTKWQFPKPKGGVEVAVTYPFIFKTLGR